MLSPSFKFSAITRDKPEVYMIICLFQLHETQSSTSLLTHSKIQNINKLSLIRHSLGYKWTWTILKYNAKEVNLAAQSLSSTLAHLWILLDNLYFFWNLLDIIATSVQVSSAARQSIKFQNVTKYPFNFPLGRLAKKYGYLARSRSLD